MDSSVVPGKYWKIRIWWPLNITILSCQRIKTLLIYLRIRFIVGENGGI